MFLKTTTIDCGYIHPHYAAAYLVQDGKKAFFVENNTTHSVPRLLKALSDQDLKPEQVEFLIITHVHLDHAGGTSALLKACPNAVLYAHPRAAPHVIDPSRLVSSARRVYGEKAFDLLYGVIEPVSAERVRTVVDEEVILFGSSELRFLFTRGHANHHMCIQMGEGKGSVIFTGDSFGLAYPILQTRDLFIFPSTSPTDFDAEEARKSIHKIAKCGAEAALLTHFGEVKNLEKAADILIRKIDLSEKLVIDAQKSELPDESLNGFCEKELRRQMSEDLEQFGMSLSGEIADLLKLDLELNGAGLAHVAKKNRH